MRKNLHRLEVGESLDPSDWYLVDQAKIDAFADATGDKQWIHIDQTRCEKESPFGCTIAHGLMSTALMPHLFYELIELPSTQAKLLNYGMDSLRYLEPVRINDRIRYHSKLVDKTEKTTGLLFRFESTVEIENRDKPAMVGQFLMLLVS